MTKRNVCRFCGRNGHTALLCMARPKNRLVTKKHIKRLGKHGQKWLRERTEWIKQNPGPWYCHYCGDQLSEKELTLDHYYSKGRRPDLRYDWANLVPCCWFDNQSKGSLSGDEYMLKLKGKEATK